jgi:hypothetical protein
MAPPLIVLIAASRAFEQGDHHRDRHQESETDGLRLNPWPDPRHWQRL